MMLNTEFESLQGWMVLTGKSKQKLNGGVTGTGGTNGESTPPPYFVI